MTTIGHPSLEAELRREPTAFRVLTGDRPTGPLHVGHYFGALENRVRRQRLGVEPDELLVSTPDAERIAAELDARRPRS